MRGSSQIRGPLLASIAVSFVGVLAAVHFACAPAAKQQAISPERQKAIQDSLRGVWERQRNIAWSTAYENYKNKQYERTVRPFWRVIALDTTHIFKDLPYRYLADSYFHLGDPDSAEVVYKMGVKVFPESQQLHRNLGYMYMNREQIEGAISEYETAVRVDSGTADDYRVLGNLYVRNNQIDEAIDAFEKVLQMDKEDEGTRKVLAQLYKSAGRSEEALKAMEDALANDPENTRLLFDLGKAYYDRQDWEKAKAKFERLLELTPKDVDVLTYLGHSHQQLGEWRAAIGVFERVLKTDTENKRAMCEIASCYKELGQFVRGRNYANRALRVDPEYGYAFLVRGEIYQAAADKCSEGRDLKFDDKLIYKLAYDEMAKAKRDPEWSDDAERYMSYLATLIPTQEDYFFHSSQKRAQLDCYQWIYR